MEKTALEKIVEVIRLLFRGVPAGGKTGVPAMKCVNYYCKLDKTHKGYIRNRGQQGKSMIPKISEIFVTGPLPDPDAVFLSGDLSLIIIDDGVLSHFFNHPSRKERVSSEFHSDLEELLLLWYGWNQAQLEDLKIFLDGMGVDLHFLPEMFFREESVRQRYTALKEDPDFYLKVFSSLHSWDVVFSRFVPVYLYDLERRYEVDLSDLRLSQSMAVRTAV